MADPVNEGKPEVVDIQPDKEGKYPETVPWKQYVGIKESLGKKLDSATQKVASLEEQLKKAPNPEEFIKTKAELETVKAEHKKVSDELKVTKEATISEKRKALIAKGVPELQVKDLSEKELDTISGVLGATVSTKPKPDLGSGGGGSATASAKDRIRQGFQTLHPS